MANSVKIFIQTKRSFLKDYLIVIFNHLSDDFNFYSHLNLESADLVLIDTETICINEMIDGSLKKPVLLFTKKLKPWIIYYLNKSENNGIFFYGMSKEDFNKTIVTAFENDFFYCEEVISVLFSSSSNEIVNKVNSLTTRELEIIALMIEDYSNEEISKKNNISIRTVNTHKRNIMKKIGSKTTTGMMKVIFDYSLHFRKLF